MKHHLLRIYHDERGATAVEYGLLALLIMLVIVLAVQGTGVSLTNPFTDVSSNL